MSKKRNIEFLPGGKVRYNAIKKFNDNIIKIPSYVVDEVVSNKSKIDIYHQGKYKVTYSWENLINYIAGIEQKEYSGRFRLKRIKYRLNRVEI
jgi:hypothetical protein